MPRRRPKRTIHLCWLLLLPIIYASNPLHAANLSQEQRISEGLEAALSAGAPLWLEAESVRFLAIHSETASAQRHGAAIILHDSGAHADWHEVINPLRRHLTGRGWETLSLQVPLDDDPSDPAPPGSLIAASTPRIQAGVDFLKSRQIDNIVLIGHGSGAWMAMHFISRKGSGIRALVAIGMALTPGSDKDPVFQAIKAVELPMLDLYGSRDLPGVVDSASQRRALALRNGWNRYRQDRVSGADHYFRGMQEELSSRVAAWLNQAAGQPAASTPSTP